MEYRQYCLASYRTATDLGRAIDALKAAGVPRKSYSIIRFSRSSILPQSGKKRGRITHFPERDSVICDGSFFQDVGILHHYDSTGHVPIDLSLFFNAIGMPKKRFSMYEDYLKQGNTLLLTYGLEDVIRQHCKTLDGFGDEKPVLFLS